MKPVMKTNKNGLEIDIAIATVDDSLLISHLLELYVYDFTEYMDFDVDDEGLFHYPFTEYFSEKDHYIYIVYVNSKIAGIVLVHKIIDNNISRYSIAEFFVLKKYRQKGIGHLMAGIIFSLHPGLWLVYQSKKNIPAQVFWRKAIDVYAQGNFREYVKDGKPHQKFEIKK